MATLTALWSEPLPHPQRFVAGNDIRLHLGDELSVQIRHGLQLLCVQSSLDFWQVLREHIAQYTVTIVCVFVCARKDLSICARVYPASDKVSSVAEERGGKFNTKLYPC